MFKKGLAVLVTCLMFPLAACAAEDNAKFVEGKHFERIAKPVPSRHPGKIEVIEFFWYGCIHCYNFEPQLEQWKKTLPDDVVVEGSPAIWRPNPMEAHARAYYAAQVLGVSETMHGAIFSAMNVERKPLASEAALADFFAKYGVDKEQFGKAYNSFGVSSQVRQATARAKGAGLQGTPELMVNGKYRISGSMAGDAGMIAVADYLIELERNGS